MTNTLRAAREQAIRDHMRLENEGAWDAVLATFERPRYEFPVPRSSDTGPYMIYDGAEEVMDYFRTSRTAFPDLGNEIIHVVVGDGDVGMTEFFLIGTHLGPMGNIPPTGRKIRVRMAATFEFKPGSDKIISERPYTDPRAILHQLGIG